MVLIVRQGTAFGYFLSQDLTILRGFWRRFYMQMDFGEEEGKELQQVGADPENGGG